MKRTFTLLMLVAALAAFSGEAKADVFVLTTTLTGAQEVPPNGSPGIGSALVTVNTVTNLMTVNVSFAGLVSPTLASHIHCCTSPGANALVATPFPGFPLGVTSGTYLQTFDLTLASSYSPSFITAHGGTVAGAQADFIAGLLAGQTYLNIHTTMFPGGEIRGQLVQVQPVPEPATLLLLGTGLVGVVGAARRRRMAVNS
jgi:hypothetical protein